MYEVHGDIRKKKQILVKNLLQPVLFFSFIDEYEDMRSTGRQFSGFVLAQAL